MPKLLQPMPTTVTSSRPILRVSTMFPFTAVTDGCGGLPIAHDRRERPAKHLELPANEVGLDDAVARLFGHSGESRKEDEVQQGAPALAQLRKQLVAHRFEGCRHRAQGSGAGATPPRAGGAHDLAERLIGRVPHQVPGGVDESADPSLDRGHTRREARDALPEVDQNPVQDRVENGRLIAELVLDAAPRDPRALRDPGNCRLVQPLLGDDPDRRAEHFLPRLAGPCELRGTRAAMASTRARWHGRAGGPRPSREAFRPDRGTPPRRGSWSAPDATRSPRWSPGRRAPRASARDAGRSSRRSLPAPGRSERRARRIRRPGRRGSLRRSLPTGSSAPGRPPTGS